VSAPSTTLGFELPAVRANAWRSRIIAIFLIACIGGIFWVDSRYPSLLKKYHAGTHVKAVGAITFDAVYEVDRSMPLAQRVWRTSVNWLNANRIGMIFAFFFGPALTFLATVQRRIANGSGNSRKIMASTTMLNAGELLKLASVLLLIFVFAPFIAERQTQPAFAEAECPVDLVTSGTWTQALVGTIKCYVKSFGSYFAWASR
jgi:hypothetical protein